MKKIIIAIICLVTVLIVTILPTFAFTQSADTAQNEDCIFTLNGQGTFFNEAFMNMYGEYFFNTYGDVLIFTAPKLRVRDRSTNLLLPISEYGYYVYFNADDNRGTWLFHIYDPANDEHYYRNVIDTNIYAFQSDHHSPIIYNQNIENIIARFREQAYDPYYNFAFWSAFKIADTTMQIVPSRYQGVLGYESGYTDGYGVGKADGVQEGITQGIQQGYTESINTRTTFKQFVSAIFTAPGHFISTVFDFEIFGYNLSNVIRVLFTIALLAFALILIVKFII